MRTGVCEGSGTGDSAGIGLGFVAGDCTGIGRALHGGAEGGDGEERDEQAEAEAHLRG